ncbi:hypothetical protein AAVH_19463 [Aphelenchoides avenae]|nr:hypothetical protein AAVH_19463 [Aphelenchus avenae]
MDKMLVVSRRWSNVIGGAESSLQQRRRFSMDIKFYGESPGLLSIRFDRRVRSEQWRILRVLTTRGLSQALSAVQSHMQNALVEGVFPFFMDRVLPPSPPRKMLIDIPLSARIPLNWEIRSWFVADNVIGSDNLLTLASRALEPHRNLGSVQVLELGLFKHDATWAQLASLLREPSIRAFSEISVWTTRAAIDTFELRAILSSWQSRKLHVIVSNGTEPHDSLLTLPTQVIHDFVALRDANRFVAEFSLHLRKPDNVAFSLMPDIDEATDRRKRFRYHLEGEDTVVRVSVYENPAVGEYLSVVTFDHFCRTVVFFNGNMSVADLKARFQRPYAFY